MKTKHQISIGIGALILLCSALWSFQYYRVEQTLTIQEALQQKKIKVEFKSNGSYQGSSINASIINLSATPLRIKIPAGSLFQAQNSDEQNLVLVQDATMAIAPKAENKRTLDGFCCIASNHCPKSGNKFTLQGKPLEKVNGLVAFLKGKQYDHTTIQDAVWALSDGHDVSNVYDDNQAKGEALRNELYRLTGQKKVWCTTPQERTVDEEGNINSETVAISGNVTFVLPAATDVHQEVHDDQGKVIWKADKNTRLEKGKVEYGFSLAVKGWEKGIYHLRVIGGGKVLQDNSFKV